MRPAVSTPSLSTPLPLSSGHARRAAPPAIYGCRAGVRCARIYAWGSGDLRDQAADGRRSRPVLSTDTLPYLTLYRPRERGRAARACTRPTGHGARPTVDTATKNYTSSLTASGAGYGVRGEANSHYH